MENTVVLSHRTPVYKTTQYIKNIKKENEQ